MSNFCKHCGNSNLCQPCAQAAHATYYDDADTPPYEDEGTITRIRITAQPLINISSGEDASPSLGIMEKLDALEQA